MKLVTYVSGVFLAVLGAQAVVVLGVWLVTRSPVVDGAVAQSNLFQNEAKTAVYQSYVVAHEASGPEVVITGSSDSTLGLRPDELSPLLGNARVHNLAIGGEDVGGSRGVVDLIYRQTPPKDRRNIVFVIGIFYQLMVDDRRRRLTGLTEVDNELLRYGLFTPSGGAIHTVIPDGWLPESLVAAWPFMAPYALYAQSMRRFFPHHLPSNVPARWYPPEAARNVIRYPLSEHAPRLGYIADRMGPVSALTGYEYEKLVELGQYISQNGGSLVVLDLPLPQWQMQASPYFADYQQRKKPYIARLQKIPHVYYATMQDLSDENLFFDEVHPRPSTTPLWASRASAAIKEALGHH